MNFKAFILLFFGEFSDLSVDELVSGTSSLRSLIGLVSVTLAWRQMRLLRCVRGV